MRPIKLELKKALVMRRPMKGLSFGGEFLWKPLLHE